MEKEKIEALKDGQRFIVHEGDFGHAEIWKINNYYFLFSIPFFGGLATFEKSYKLEQIDEMINYYKSWT